MEAQIKDYMVSMSEYPTINVKDTLARAVEIMCRKAREKGYRWVIVLDDDGNLAGFLTLRNVFEAITNLVPEEGNWMGIHTRAQLLKHTPLGQCIRPLVNVAVRETDHPIKAADIILKHRITILPVLNERDEVVGIVRPVDILPFINRLFNNDQGDCV